MRGLDEKKDSGPILDWNRKRNAITGRLQKMTPKNWNNIPLPLQDILTDMVSFTTAQSKLSVHHESFMHDLSVICQNMFMFTEAIADDMRVQIRDRMTNLN